MQAPQSADFNSFHVRTGVSAEMLILLGLLNEI